MRRRLVVAARREQDFRCRNAVAEALRDEYLARADPLTRAAVSGQAEASEADNQHRSCGKLGSGHCCAGNDGYCRGGGRLAETHKFR
jgi:hypothetical protein